MRFCTAPGQHVLTGEPLILFEHEPADTRKLQRSIPIGPFRTGAQSTVFEIRLLVEVAIRAMSPGINDQYTAITCADRIAHALYGQAATWIDQPSDPDATAMPVYEKAPHFELPGQDMRNLFEDPLATFRQSAISYPAVTIRMIGNYRRVADRLRNDGGSGQLIAFLFAKAKILADHAIAETRFDQDRQDIADALERFRQEHGPFDRRIV